MNGESAAFEAKIMVACRGLLAQVGAARVIVALSGGRDSTVLLHALAKRRADLDVPLTAMHVNHGLQVDSDRWAAQCAVQCAALAVPLHIVKLTSGPPAGASLEAWAREARYGSFARSLVPRDLLLTAHHQDDQAETFLLNALRGAGPAGLRGIAPLRPLGRAWLGRPLLSLQSDAIAHYAVRTSLEWHEDPMNAATNLDRSFLRQHVRPLLREHWPAASRTLARSAALQRAAATREQMLADRILETAPVSSPRALTLTRLTDLTTDLQASVLRRWIARAGFPAPDATHLERILTCVIAARGDRIPSVTWKGVCVRRYAETLFLLRERPLPATALERVWQPAHPLQLPGGILSAVSTHSEGLRADAVRAGLTVRVRTGGERCRLPGRTHHTTLKHLLQTYRVPPWERGDLPLVYVERELAAVADLFVCADFVAAKEAPGWRLCWAPHTAFEQAQ